MNKVIKYLFTFMAIGLPFWTNAQFSSTDSLQVKALFAQADSLRFIDANRALSAWNVAADYCAQIGWQEQYVAASILPGRNHKPTYGQQYIYQIQAAQNQLH